MIDAMRVVRKNSRQKVAGFLKMKMPITNGTDGSDACPYGIGRTKRQCLGGLCQ